ncbi:alpha/beta hydrolase [Streptomyces sp. NPDC050161]|uniref:alpha/beta hydrolase n=1 Tax=Streptomyces sp. NPDC050161 TaxID=3365604 RepID=UPI0037AAC51C
MSAADEEAALLGLAPVAPERTVAYGPHPDQIVDLYPPAAGAARGPLVVLFHGGFWRAAYDRRHLSPLAAALAGQGLPVALAEYRRVGAGGGGARTFDDATAAVTASVTAVRDAGAGESTAEGAVSGGAAAGAPGERPVLVGHSAGGHLALLAAARLGPAAVGRVVAVAPVADLAGAHRLGLSDHAVTALLGEGPGLAERIAAADPVRHPPAGVPVTLLHGDDDREVPPELSRRFAAACHPAATLHELPGVGHYAPVTPGTPACRTLLGALLAAAHTG